MLHKNQNYAVSCQWVLSLHCCPVYTDPVRPLSVSLPVRTPALHGVQVRLVDEAGVFTVEVHRAPVVRERGVTLLIRVSQEVGELVHCNYSTR